MLQAQEPDCQAWQRFTLICSVCNRACGWLAYTVAEYSHTREQTRTSQGCSPKKQVGGRLKQDLDKDYETI